MVTDRYKRWAPVGCEDEPVVVDHKTGLLWQGTPAPEPMTWLEALDYAEALKWGHWDDWRLPTIEELASIVDYSQHNSAIDQEVFPATLSDCFWSSSSYVANTAYAWHVYFYNGFVNFVPKGYDYCVRCVRTRS